MTIRSAVKMLAPGGTANVVKTVAGKAVWALVNLAELADVDVVTTPPTDKQALRYNAATGKWAPGGATLVVQDENTNVSTAVGQMDFQGGGVTVTNGTGEVVVTIPSQVLLLEKGVLTPPAGTPVGTLIFQKA